MKAIYHFHLETLPRRRGRNLVQMAAYITGQKLRNWATGRVFGRRSTESIITHDLVGTKLSSEEFFNRSEAAERRSDAMVGRHVIVALPRGMEREQMLQLLRQLAVEISATAQVPVLYALHESREAGPDQNPHGHVLFGGRPWDELTQTFARRRFRELDVIWSGRVIIEEFRETWEKLVNAQLPPQVARVSRLSHARQGNGRIARRHLGYHAMFLERMGVRTHDGDFNAQVEEVDVYDRALGAMDTQEAALRAELEAITSLAPLSAGESRRHAAAALEPDPLAPMSAARSRQLAGVVDPTGEARAKARRDKALFPPELPVTPQPRLTTISEAELQEVLLPFRRHAPRDSVSFPELRLDAQT